MLSLKEIGLSMEKRRVGVGCWQTQSDTTVYKNHETCVFMGFGTVLARFFIVADDVPKCHLAPIGSDSVKFLPLF